MTKSFIAFVGLAFTLLFVACKKDSKTQTCNISIDEIAGTYKVTKVESVTGGTTVDVSSSILTSCPASGIYKLNADKTLTYTELPACSGNGNGTWDIVSGKISIIQTGNGFDLVSATVNSFNCSVMVATQDIGAGASFVYTFTKQ